MGYKISYSAFRDNGCLGYLTIDKGTRDMCSIPFTQYYPQLRSYFKPHRCLTCIDHYGETADICFGDIHIKPYSDDHIGISSWIVRSNYWNNLVKQAASENCIKMEPLAPDILNRSQAGMLLPKKRRAKAVMNMDAMIGRAAPCYDKILDTPKLSDYVKMLVCHLQRFIGRRPNLWFVINPLNKFGRR